MDSDGNMMKYVSLLVWLIFICFSFSNALRDDDDLSVLMFPKNFTFGAATSAYQIEGAWNIDGKGENIWDHLAHSKNSPIKNQNTGDVACDSYNYYKEDVKQLSALGAHHYRFSLSWSRILPTGYTNKINQLGVQYYKNLLNELKAYNIIPMVTIYHWDLPQPLQDLGGWPNVMMVDLFADYAKLVFDLFGDDVKWWITFNEVQQICHEGYGNGAKAPALKSPGIGEYLCSHMVIKAHAKAYRIYEDQFKKKQGGKVGIVIDTDWYQPATDSDEDIKAAESSRYFRWGWYVHPLVFGNYPDVMIDRIAMRSEKEGFLKSRLPVFTEEEKNSIEGSYDFLGLNQYSSLVVEHIDEPEFGTPSWEKDMGTLCYRNESWAKSASDWDYVTPWGIRKTLKWISDTYKNPDIIITENGYSDYYGSLSDPNRTDYILRYLSNILDSIHTDNVNVFGYTIWSLLDNLEWYSGFTEKFGIVQVDFDSENKTRTPKDSFGTYQFIIKHRCLGNLCVCTARDPDCDYISYA